MEGCYFLLWLSVQLSFFKQVSEVEKQFLFLILIFVLWVRVRFLSCQVNGRLVYSIRYQYGESVFRVFTFWNSGWFWALVLFYFVLLLFDEWVEGCRQDYRGVYWFLGIGLCCLLRGFWVGFLFVRAFWVFFFKLQRKLKYLGRGRVGFIKFLYLFDFYGFYVFKRQLGVVGGAWFGVRYFGLNFNVVWVFV